MLYICLFTFSVSVLTQLLKTYPTYVATISFLSSGIEALLGVPQFLLNFKRKNTEGLAVILILIWLGGDCYKFSYYASNNSPLALVVCAGFQIMTDLCILSQFWIYRGASKEGGAESN